MTLQFFPSDLEVAFLGPSLEEGKLPTLLYLALSAEESLLKDPYNQPVRYLEKNRMRIFSISLPSHEEKKSPYEAMAVWADHLRDGEDIVGSFIESVKKIIDSLKFSIDGPLGVMGLSRGGFMACHLAAKIPEVAPVLGFASAISLASVKEFESLQTDPLLTSLSLSYRTTELVGKPLRFYMGNRDTKVDTKECCTFITDLAESSYQKGIISPEVELILYPSIGQAGHGTPEEIFNQGAHWMGQKLGVLL